MSKPLAKSLHTITVLVRVATLHLNRIGPDKPLSIALYAQWLGLK